MQLLSLRPKEQERLDKIKALADAEAAEKARLEQERIDKMIYTQMWKGWKGKISAWKKSANGKNKIAERQAVVKGKLAWKKEILGEQVAEDEELMKDRAVRAYLCEGKVWGLMCFKTALKKKTKKTRLKGLLLDIFWLDCFLQLVI